MNTPLMRAVAAAAYIVGIVFVIHGLSRFEDNLLFPMTFLSLLVLSALAMGYLFVWEPLRLYLDNKKEEAVKFFVRTVGYFAVFAVAIACAAILFSPIG